jgi:hypothetical protein
LEEERERREQEKLELLRKKDKHEQSAIASSEVKQKLQVGFYNDLSLGRLFVSLLYNIKSYKVPFGKLLPLIRLF